MHENNAYIAGEAMKDLEQEMKDAIQKPLGELMDKFEQMHMKMTCENESFYKMGFVDAYRLLKEKEALKKINDNQKV